jgi:threonine dehydrogenase-like Zn-dependent dehydrogenase
MKCAQIIAPRQIRLLESDPPEPDGTISGDLIVKADLCSICGSDLPSFYLEQDRYPLPIGQHIHECIGTVVAGFSKRFREGDMVLVHPKDYCGLSEYYRSHEDTCVLLDRQANKDHLLMSQPLGTVLTAIRKLGNLTNQVVVVIGQGPIGLLFTSVLSNLGARRVIVADKEDYRLEVSRKMHATDTINAARQDVIEAVSAITEGRLADLVVEAVGQQQATLNLCIDLVKKGGSVITFGIPVTDHYLINFRRFFEKNMKLISSCWPDPEIDFPLAMDMIAQGRIKVSPIISHRLPFAEIQTGFEMAYAKSNGAVKIIVDFNL